jgi:hypothetical protein
MQPPFKCLSFIIADSSLGVLVLAGTLDSETYIVSSRLIAVLKPLEM